MNAKDVWLNYLWSEVCLSTYLVRKNIFMNECLQQQLTRSMPYVFVVEKLSIHLTVGRVIMQIRVKYALNDWAFLAKNRSVTGSSLMNK